MDKSVRYDASQDRVVFHLQGETSEWVEAVVTGEALAQAYGCEPGRAARLQVFADHEREIRDKAEQMLDEGMEPTVGVEDLAPHNRSGATKEAVRGIGEDSEGSID